MNDEQKSRENEPVVGNLDDYKRIAQQEAYKAAQQRTCPNCGYCPCCGRPYANFNYPTQPYWGWPYPMTGPTCGTGVKP